MTNHIDTIVVSGNGNQNDGTASSGSNYECVDEAPMSETDYVTLDAANEVELYSLNSYSLTNEVIHAVKVGFVTKKEDVGDRSVATVIRINSTDYVFSTDLYIGVDYNRADNNIWILNPDDSAAWEVVDINNMQVGIKITA